jgi:formylglycine-generating enzyme required for sulfatase activity
MLCCSGMCRGKAALTLIACCTLWGQEAPRRRLAVLIGNGQYQSLPPVKSAIHDTQAIAAALSANGFTTLTRTDLTIAGWRTMEQSLERQLQAGDVVVFYFTGYGLQQGGDNWLAPVDYKPGDGRPVASKAYSVLRLKQLLEDRDVILRVFLLDAARENPLLLQDAHGESGLGPMDVDDKTIVAYAVPPNQTEPLRPDEQTAFAAALIKVLGQPGLRVTQLFGEELLRAFAAVAPNRIRPMTYTQVFRDWFFRLPPTPPKEVVTVTPPKQKLLRKTGDVWENQKEELKYVYIEPGVFELGCVEIDKKCKDDEKPRHPVTLTRGFWISRTEVTVLAYRRFAEQNKRKMPPPTQTNPDWRDTYHPISRINWDDAHDYCVSIGGRLPTEAEWEYAARAGKRGMLYTWGNELDRNRANFDGKDKRSKDKYDESAPVATFPENEWGVFDMTGNVSEWVADYYVPFSGGPQVDPSGPVSGKERVVKGGSFAGTPEQLRLSIREHFPPQNTGNRLGFRCVIDQIPES